MSVRLPRRRSFLFVPCAHPSSNPAGLGPPVAALALYAGRIRWPKPRSRASGIPGSTRVLPAVHAGGRDSGARLHFCVLHTASPLVDAGYLAWAVSADAAQLARPSDAGVGIAGAGSTASTSLPAAIVLFEWLRDRATACSGYVNN